MNEAGTHLPLITRRQSSKLASGILQRAAIQIVGSPLSKDLRTKLAAIALGNRASRKKALEHVLLLQSTPTTDPERLKLRDSDFSELACMFAIHLPVVCLFTGGPAGRSIVKLSYVEPLGEDYSTSKGRKRRAIGWKSENLAVGINEIGAGASHHIEIDIPEDLQVNYISLTGKSYTLANVNWRHLQSSEKDYSIRQVGRASSGNIYLSGLPHARRMGRASIKMRVRRTRFLMGALVASTIITAVLVVLALVASDIINADKSDASVAALLLLPSVVATYIARPGQHMLTARMTRWARFALVGNAALPFLAALVFFTTPEVNSASPGVNLGGFANSVLSLVQQQNSPTHGLQARWAFLATLSGLFTCMFLISNIWPRPHGLSHYEPMLDVPE